MCVCVRNLKKVPCFAPYITRGVWRKPAGGPSKRQRIRRRMSEGMSAEREKPSEKERDCGSVWYYLLGHAPFRRVQTEEALCHRLGKLSEKHQGLLCGQTCVSLRPRYTSADTALCNTDKDVRIGVFQVYLFWCSCRQADTDKLSAYALQPSCTECLRTMTLLY